MAPTTPRPALCGTYPDTVSSHPSQKRAPGPFCKGLCTWSAHPILIWCQKGPWLATAGPHHWDTQRQVPRPGGSDPDGTVAPPPGQRGAYHKKRTSIDEATSLGPVCPIPSECECVRGHNRTNQPQTHVPLYSFPPDRDWLQQRQQREKTLTRTKPNACEYSCTPPPGPLCGSIATGARCFYAC